MKRKHRTKRWEFSYANSVAIRTLCAPDLLITNCKEDEFERIIDKFKINTGLVDSLSDSENNTEQINNEYNFDQKHKRYKALNSSRKSSLRNTSKIISTRQSKNKKEKKKNLLVNSFPVDNCDLVTSLKTNCQNYDCSKYILSAPDTLITDYNEKQFEHIIDKFKEKTEDSKSLCYSENIKELFKNEYNFNKKSEGLKNVDLSKKFELQFIPKKNSIRQSKNKKNLKFNICCVDKCNFESFHPVLTDERKIIKKLLSLFGLHQINLNISIRKNYKCANNSLCKDHRQMVDIIISCQLCNNKLPDDLDCEIWKMYDEWNHILAINEIYLVLKPGMFVCSTCQYFLIEIDFKSSGTLKCIQKNVLKKNFKLIEIFGSSPKPISGIHQSSSNVIRPNVIVETLSKPMNSKKVRFADTLVPETNIVERPINGEDPIYKEFEEENSTIDKQCMEGSPEIQKHEEKNNESVLYNRVIKMASLSKYENTDLMNKSEKIGFYHVVNINSQKENKNEYHFELVHIKPKIDPAYQNSFEHINEHSVKLKKTLRPDIHIKNSYVDMKNQKSEYNKTVHFNGQMSGNYFYENDPIKSNAFKYFRNETTLDSNYINLVSDENEKIDTVYVSIDDNEKVDTVYVSSDEDEEISYDKAVHIKPKIDLIHQKYNSHEHFPENSVKLKNTLPNGGMYNKNSNVGMKKQKLESNKTVTFIEPKTTNILYKNDSIKNFTYEHRKNETISDSNYNNLIKDENEKVDAVYVSSDEDEEISYDKLVHMEPKIDLMHQKYNSYDHFLKNSVKLRNTLPNSMYNKNSNVGMKKQKLESNKTVTFIEPKTTNILYKNDSIKNFTYKHRKNETISDSNYNNLIKDENEKVDAVYVSSDEDEEISYDKLVHMEPKIDLIHQKYNSYEHFLKNSVKLKNTLPNGMYNKNSNGGMKKQKLESNKTVTFIEPKTTNILYKNDSIKNFTYEDRKNETISDSNYNNLIKDENEKVDAVYVSSDEDEEISYDKLVHMEPKIDLMHQKYNSYEHFPENSVKLKNILPNSMYIKNCNVGMKNQKLESNKTVTSIEPRTINIFYKNDSIKNFTYEHRKNETISDSNYNNLIKDENEKIDTVYVSSDEN